jgi:hypothetical protein
MRLGWRVLLPAVQRNGMTTCVCYDMMTACRPMMSDEPTAQQCRRLVGA